LSAQVDADAVRDEIQIENEWIKKLRNVLKDIERVNEGMEDTDGTVEFSNIGLQRELRELTMKMKKIEDRANQLREDIYGAGDGTRYRRVLRDRIRSLRRMPDTLTIELKNGQHRQSKTLKSEIEKLERILAEKRQGNGMVVRDQLQSIRDAIAQTGELSRKYNREIQKMRARFETPRVQVRRTDFDPYETLKDESHEIRKRYFALKDRLQPAIPRSQRLKMEEDLEALQERYTEVMVSLEKFTPASTREEMRAARRKSGLARKELTDQISQTKEVTDACLEKEREEGAAEETLRRITRKVMNQRNASDVIRFQEIVMERLKAVEMVDEIDQWARERLCALKIAADDQNVIHQLYQAVENLMRRQGESVQWKLAVHRLQQRVSVLAGK
jgi:hypothetical protein